MDRTVLGLYHSPWKSSYDPHESIVELYRSAVWQKANPRDEGYMKALFLERYSHGIFVNADDDPNWRHAVPVADTVVMLYPDATGLYFSPFESIVLREKKTWAGIRVLNGRRRDFLYSRGVRRALRWRRLCERLMAGELLAIALFLAATPVFMVSDIARKRK